MSLKDFLLLMGVATALAWGSWIYVLFQVDPHETGLMGFVLFYVTLFASLVGTMAILGSVYRVVLRKRQQKCASPFGTR